VRALHKKFSLLYLQKFTSAFPDTETVDEWCGVWAKSLSGLDGDQIGHGLDYCGKQHEWPPTTAEFRMACLSLRKHFPQIEHKPTRNTEAQRERMAELMRFAMTATAPKDHWRKVFATKGLPEISYRYAGEALALIDPYGDWKTMEKAA